MDLTKIIWAVNKQKLAASLTRLQSQKKLNPMFEITEKALLEDYRKSAGLVIETNVPKEKEVPKKSEPVVPVDKVGSK